MNKTLNQLLLDASLRHQISLRRYSKAQVKKVLGLLEKADSELAMKLQARLINLAGKPLDMKSARFQALLVDIKAMRSEVMSKIEVETTADLRGLAKVEADHEFALLRELIPVEITLASIAVDTLYAATVEHPFAGGSAGARTLKQWFDTLRTADQNKLVEAIQLGLAQGETVDDMVRRVVGTRANKYADGILAITRRNAEAVVRTGINHISNAAREQIMTQNESMILALRVVATLDGRTSAVCRGRDGALTPVGNNVLPKGVKLLDPPGARPPFHPNCRTVMIAVISEEGMLEQLGDRPYVTDARTGKQREVDFRADAKSAVGQDAWKGMSEAQRRDAIKQVKAVWTKNNVGQIPANTTYNDWLKTQSVAFQEDVLGVKKAQLYRSGKFSLDEFIDHTGKEYTLDDLAAMKPGAFQ